MWQSQLKGYKAFLSLERSLSKNSIEAYLHDVNKLISFLQSTAQDIAIDKVRLEDLQQFVQHLTELGLAAGSQARIISGLKSFFNFFTTGGRNYDIAR